jgi:hypothetical protein
MRKNLREISAKFRALQDALLEAKSKEEKMEIIASLALNEKEARKKFIEKSKKIIESSKK